MCEDTGCEGLWEEASSHFKCSNRRRRGHHFKVKSCNENKLFSSHRMGYVLLFWDRDVEERIKICLSQGQPCSGSPSTFLTRVFQLLLVYASRWNSVLWCAPRFSPGSYSVCLVLFAFGQILSNFKGISYHCYVDDIQVCISCNPPDVLKCL